MIKFQERERVNVIAVDWGQGALYPLYNDASANTRLVGRQTCLLIKSIRKLYFNDIWDKDLHVHCIGLLQNISVFLYCIPHVCVNVRSQPWCPHLWLCW